MKNFTGIILLLLTILYSCNGSKENNLKEFERIVGKTLFKIDTINGSVVVDTRCGSGSPMVKVWENYLYYYYPMEGQNYSIKSSSYSNHIYKFDLELLEDKSISRNFEIKDKGEFFELFFHDSFIGIFIDSLIVNNKIKYYQSPDCDNLEDIVNEHDNEFLGNWSDDCESSNYITINSLGVYLNFPDYFLVNAKFQRNYANEVLLTFSPPPITPISSDMDWENFSDDSSIAIITKSEQDVVTFKWLGFFNKKTYTRDFLKSGFITQEAILEKCDSKN